MRVDWWRRWALGRDGCSHCFPVLLTKSALASAGLRASGSVAGGRMLLHCRLLLIADSATPAAESRQRAGIRLQNGWNTAMFGCDLLHRGQVIQFDARPAVGRAVGAQHIPRRWNGVAVWPNWRLGGVRKAGKCDAQQILMLGAAVGAERFVCPWCATDTQVSIERVGVGDDMHGGAPVMVTTWLVQSAELFYQSNHS